MRLEVEREVLAPPHVVWDVLTTWELQPRWMLDAIDIEVLTAERAGVGVTIKCPTRLLGFKVNDVMRVTAWEPAVRLEVEHLGRIITGSGAFEMEALPGDATRMVWWEVVDPPLGRLGEWGASTFVLPWMRRLFSRSLANLGDLAERRHAGDEPADL
ncbi:MAG: SRPBCC family protein [Nitriliruptoraceae bacterium]